MGKVSIYTHTIHTQTLYSHGTVHTCQCVQFFFQWYQVTAWQSLTHRQKQRGEVSGAVAGAGAPMM